MHGGDRAMYQWSGCGAQPASVQADGRGAQPASVRADRRRDTSITVIYILSTYIIIKEILTNSLYCTCTDFKSSENINFSSHTCFTDFQGGTCLSFVSSVMSWSIEKKIVTSWLR
jgi:hypothetical protein